jgi:hypothetical protein
MKIWMMVPTAAVTGSRCSDAEPEDSRRCEANSRCCSRLTVACVQRNCHYSVLRGAIELKALRCRVSVNGTGRGQNPFPAMHPDYHGLLMMSRVGVRQRWGLFNLENEVDDDSSFIVDWYG